MQFLTVVLYTIMVPVLVFVTLRFIIPCENRHYQIPIRDLDPIPYETLIINPNEVLLISDDSDTILLELINSNNLAAEWVIRIRQKR